MTRLLTLLLLLIASPLWAAVSYDSVANSGLLSGVNTASYTHTVGGGCSNAAVAIGIYGYGGDRTVTSVTVGTGGGLVNAVEMGGQYANGDGGGYNQWTALWVASGVGTAGQAINVTLNSSQTKLYVSTVSYCGVNALTPTGTAVISYDLNTTPTIAGISSATGEIAVGAVIQRENTGSSTCAVSSINNRDNATETYYSTYLLGDTAGAASVNLTWTCSDSDAWSGVGVSLKASTGIAPHRQRRLVVFQ